MKLTRQNQNFDSTCSRGWHILTVAEEGFSNLDLYGRQHQAISTEAIRQASGTEKPSKNSRCCA